jgi:mannose-1-phosphate guanylyltransferase
VTDLPLLRDTLMRVAPLAPPSRTLVLTNASLASRVAALAPELPDGHVVAEPRPAGTAAALAWAAHEVRRRGGPRAVMVCVHADWAVADVEGFRTALERAARAAVAHDALVTVGIVPSRPDVGYGYIQPGPVVDGALRRVARFVEKPDRATAERFVAEGFLWNSGIFAWTVTRFLAELAAHCPEVAPALAAAGDDAAAFFATTGNLAVDVGVLERSDRVLVLPGDFGWDDVGTWAAVHRVRQRDARGNAVHGQAYLVQAKDNVVHAEGRTVVLYGVENLVVVTAPGITMVTTRERAADLKQMLGQLPARVAERP